VQLQFRVPATDTRARTADVKSATARTRRTLSEGGARAGAGAEHDSRAALWLELESNGGHPLFTNGSVLLMILSFLDCPRDCHHRDCEMSTLLSRSKTGIDINARGLYVLGTRANSIPAYLSETHTHEVARLRAETRRKDLIRSSWTTILQQGTCPLSFLATWPLIRGLFRGGIGGANV
jgi:hypothetical protein